MVQCKNLSDVLISEYWDLLKRASAVHLVGFFFKKKIPKLFSILSHPLF